MTNSNATAIHDMNPSTYLLLLTGTLFMLSACASDDPHRRTKTGLAVGAIAGTVIGNQSSSKNGKYVGAVVGAISGAAVGSYMDKQQRELEKRLASERRNKQIAMVRIDEQTLRLDIRNEASFAINSTDLNPTFRRSLNTVAEIIGDYDKTAVHVIGHTDSTGTHAYNKGLSSKRAQTVSAHLVGNGVIKRRIRTAGRGETQPRFDNRTNTGRQLNRRVEIYLKTIVKGQESDAFQTPS